MTQPLPMPPSPIVRRAGTTVWRQIEEALAAEILAGNLKGRLPNETEAADRFGVNRHTVRQAAKALAERGLVEVVHGRGTFVREEVIDYDLGRRNRFAHSVAKARRVGKSQVLRASEVTPRPEVAKLLELPEGAKVLQIDSHDVLDGKIIGVCNQYFPLPRFRGFDAVYAETGKTHLALAHYQVNEISRRLSRITAKLPSREVAQQLGQPAAMPILYVETVYVDEHGTPIELGISRFSSTAVQLVIEP